MRLTESDRAVSTVVDVALALVVLSAAVVVLGVYLEGDDPDHDPFRADRTAETVTGTTLTAEYSIETVADEPEFDEDEVGDDDAYRRTVHGPSGGLLADAALANVRFEDDGRWDEDRLSAVGEPYEEAVGGALHARMFGANTDVHVSAIWRPYEGASIVGNATGGERPPADGDVSSVTVTVPSGIDDVDPPAGADFEEWANATADSMIEGLFPEAEMQHALEQRGLERELAVYRYQRMDAALGDDVDLDDPDEPGSPLNRSSADASAVNDRLEDALADNVEEEFEELYDDPDELEDATRLDEVRVTVRTWNA